MERLETEPTDSDELTALVQYQLDCMQLLDDLMDEYVRVWNIHGSNLTFRQH